MNTPTNLASWLSAPTAPSRAGLCGPRGSTHAASTAPGPRAPDQGRRGLRRGVRRHARHRQGHPGGCPDEGRGARWRRRTRHRRAVDSGWVVDDLVGARTVPRSWCSGMGDEQGATRLHRVDRPECRRWFPGTVVSVPEGWAPRVDVEPVVTAAVQDPVEAPALLRAAFEESRARSASLVVLHAWWLASGSTSWSSTPRIATSSPHAATKSSSRSWHRCGPSSRTSL